MDDLATLQQYLTEALAARHRLKIDGHVVLFKADGVHVEYSQRDTNELDAYITELNGKIAVLQGTGTRRGPIYV